jgi:hypothetical protein
MADYHKTPFKGGAGIAIASARKGRIWQADDHLLYQEVRGYTEENWRFYYRDIQMITVSETSTSRVVVAVNVLMALGLLALFGYLSFEVSVLQEPGDAILLAMLLVMPMALCLWFAAKNAIKGPSCKVFLHTAVHEQRIFAIPYLRDARKFQDFLRPLVRQAQGGAPADVFAPDEYATVFLAPSAHARAVEYVPACGAEKLPLNPLWHIHAFLLMFIFNVSGLFDFLYMSEFKNVIDTLIGYTYIVLLLAALIMQHRRRCPRDLMWYTWIAMAHAGVTLAAINMFAVYYSAQGQAALQGQSFNVLFAMQHQGFQIFQLLSCLFGLVISLLAALRLVRGVHVEAPAAAEALAPPPLPDGGAPAMSAPVPPGPLPVESAEP